MSLANSCPIPLPPGSDGGSFFGTNPPLPFPDRELSQLSGNDLLDGQIIVELSNTRCLSGLSFETLLDRLENNYSESFWTSALLQQRLTLGRRQGRFCLAANNSWVLRNDMVTLNYNNQKFQGLTSNIVRVPIFQTTVADTFSGVYQGNLPICGNAVCGVPQLIGLLPPGELANLRARFG